MILVGEGTNCSLKLRNTFKAVVEEDWLCNGWIQSFVYEILEGIEGMFLECTNKEVKELTRGNTLTHSEILFLLCCEVNIEYIN